MASGTFIRILIGLVIILCPFVTVFLTGNNVLWSLFLFYLLIPILIIWNDVCDCEGCFMSSRCDNIKKFNFVKSIMKFLGYDYEKINNVEFPKNYQYNNYYLIYKYIKDQVNGKTKEN